MAVYVGTNHDAQEALMTREQAITRIIRALVTAGMEAEQKNPREVIVELCNANDEYVTITVSAVKKVGS